MRSTTPALDVREPPGRSPQERLASLRAGSVFQGYLLCDALTPPGPEETAPRTFHALDLSTGRDLALTVLSGEDAELERFLEGYRDARRHLPDPHHLPRILDGGAEEGSAYLVSERIRGMDLETILVAGELPEEAAVQVVWALTLCLVQLHRRGWAHGDLHPRNVRVDAEGRIVLVGNVPHPFGQVRHARRAAESLRHYAPPEARREGVHAPTGDIYSLGLIGYRALTGEPLMPAHHPHELEGQHGAARRFFRDGARRLSGLSEPLLELLGRTLSLRPEERPEDADALMEELFLALPAGWRLEELSARLRSLYGTCAWHAGWELLERAEGLHAHGHPLAVAASLLRMDELGDGVGRAARRAARGLAEDLLWSTFEAGGGERQRRGAVALCQLLLRIDWTRYPSFLTPLIRRRLAALAEGQELPGLVLPAPLDGARRRVQRRTVVDQLLENPSRGSATLELATLMQDLEFPEGTPREAKEALVLRRAGLPRHALARVASLLPSAAEPEPLLEQARELLDEARAEPRTRARRLPPGESTEPGVLESHPPGAGRDPEALPTDPDVMFTTGQVWMAEGRLTEATEVFAELLEVGVLAERTYASVLRDEVHDLLWKALVPDPDSGPRTRLMRGLWRLARHLGLEELVPLCESLVLASLTGEDRYEVLRQLIREAPDSIRFLRAAAREARSQGDREAWKELLCLAAREFLGRWEPQQAARMVMAAWTEGATRELQEVRGEMLRVGERVAAAGAELRELLTALEGRDARLRSRGLRDLVRRYPGFSPAREALAHAAAEAGEAGPATEMRLAAARDALYREEFRSARRHLVDVLELDGENDEALLYLAALDPPGLDAPRSPKLLRAELLVREGFVEEALRRIRRELRGGEDDVPFLRAMVRICERADRDAAPYRARLAVLALDRGDTERAQELLAVAVEETEDLASLARALDGTPEALRLASSSGAPVEVGRD